jgi:hypothetical protein
MRLVLGLSAIALLLAGCSGNFYRTFKLDAETGGPGTSIASDARSRFVTNVQVGSTSRPGQVDPLRIICVEPSPDVAVAMANSLGAGISASQYGSGALSTATAEGLAQIAERTTAIQAVLRQGYQACIDYMNGAINGTTYSLRQSHLDDLLVTLVLAEDAAGAFGRKGAAISTNAQASADAAASILPNVGKGLDEATNDLSAKQQDLDAKEEAVKTAQTAADGDPTNEQKKTDLKNAQDARDKAKAARDAAMRSVTGITEASAKAAAAAIAVGQGGLTAQTDPDIAREIGDMQETFVNKDVEQAYVSTCLIELGQWKQRDPEDDELRQIAVDEASNLGLDNATLNHYYRATTLGQQTWLTEHCRNNFDTFLRRAQENRYNLDVLKLKIEAQRVQLEQLNAQNASLAIGESTNVRLDFNAAQAAHTAVSAALESLAGSAGNVPAPEPQADQDRKDLLNTLGEQKTQAQEDGRQLELKFKDLPVLSAVTAIELNRDTLAGDLRQHGDSAEQFAWQKEFNVAQAQAAQLAQRYSDYSRRAAALNRRIDHLLGEIKAAATP